MFNQFVSFAVYLYESVIPFINSIVGFLSFEVPGLGGITILHLILSTGIGVYLGIVIGKWLIGVD